MRKREEGRVERSEERGGEGRGERREGRGGMHLPERTSDAVACHGHRPYLLLAAYDLID